MNVLAQSNSLRKEGILTDVILEAGDEEFSAHRLILATASSYFMTMFTSNYKESKNHKIHIEIDPEVLSSVLDACYSSLIISDNFLFQLKVREALHFYGVHAFDIKDVQWIRIPNEHFSEYIFHLHRVHEIIPEEIWKNTISQLSCKANLNDLSDDSIIELLSSEYFSPHNMIRLVEMIDTLVEKGHSLKLYDLINFSMLPSGRRSNIPGLHPRLTKRSFNSIEDIEENYIYSIELNEVVVFGVTYDGIIKSIDSQGDEFNVSMKSTDNRYPGVGDIIVLYLIRLPGDENPNAQNWHYKYRFMG